MKLTDELRKYIKRFARNAPGIFNELEEIADNIDEEYGKTLDEFRKALDQARMNRGERGE